MKTKKELALRELTEIENRQKELRRIIEEVDNPKNIMDRVKTFEDACLIKGVKPSEVFGKSTSKDVIAYEKLKLIISVLNEGWTPNWNDSNENKYYPYFSVGSGFGFSYSNTHYDLSTTIVGFRLCLKSRELSDYVGRQFIEIYKEYLM